jgi:hypothetical protein
MILTLATAGAAIAFAAPASAQYFPVPHYPAYQPGYGYQQPGYGNNWLYNFGNQRYARMMQDRVQRIRYDIRQMGAYRILSRSEVRDLDQEARAVQDRIYRYSRHGVSHSEARRIDNRVRRLEMRVMREANDWNRGPGIRRYNVYNYDQYQNYYGRDGYRNRDGYRDRDRDGLNDYNERDRGRDYDEDRDPD